MGHRDHGKTSLLDSIASTNIAATESGAITQRVSCFHFGATPRTLSTWIDTPGHEVFFKLRSSSAVVADVVLLVVDVVEGAGPQSLEVVHKAKLLGIPLVIALNKIDKLLSPQEIASISGNSADSVLSAEGHPLCVRIESITAQLAQHHSAEHVFDAVAISATQRLNLSELLFSVDVAAAAVQVTSPREHVLPQAVVLETSSDHWTLIVHCGVLRVGHLIVGGSVLATVRRIKDAANGVDDAECLLPGQAAAVYLDFTKYPAANQLPRSGEVVFVMDRHRASKCLVVRSVLFCVFSPSTAQ